MNAQMCVREEESPPLQPMHKSVQQAMFFFLKFILNEKENSVSRM